MSGFGKGSRHTAKTLRILSEKTRKLHARRRREAELCHRDVHAWLASKTVKPGPPMRGLLEIAASDSVALAKTLSRTKPLAADVRGRIEDYVDLGVALGMAHRALETTGPDPDLLGRMVQLSSARLACLRSLGLVAAAPEGGGEGPEGLGAAAYGAALRRARGANGEDGAAGPGSSFPKPRPPGQGVGDAALPAAPAPSPDADGGAP